MIDRGALEAEAYSASESVVGAGLLPWQDALLRGWHQSDPVSDKERERNEQVQGVQGNRNPFIDHPDWVERVTFTTDASPTPSPSPGPSPSPSPSPSSSPSPSPAASCVPGQHGPPCDSDEDCSSVPDCVRCAGSGFCTDVPLGRCALDEC